MTDNDDAKPNIDLGDEGGGGGGLPFQGFNFTDDTGEASEVEVWHRTEPRSNGSVLLGSGDLPVTQPDPNTPTKTANWAGNTGNGVGQIGYRYMHGGQWSDIIWAQNATPAQHARTGQGHIAPGPAGTCSEEHY